MYMIHTPATRVSTNVVIFHRLRDDKQLPQLVQDGGLGLSEQETFQSVVINDSISL
jgi:hypothetical protein